MTDNFEPFSESDAAYMETATPAYSREELVAEDTGVPVTYAPQPFAPDEPALVGPLSPIGGGDYSQTGATNPVGDIAPLSPVYTPSAIVMPGDYGDGTSLPPPFVSLPEPIEYARAYARPLGPQDATPEQVQTYAVNLSGGSLAPTRGWLDFQVATVADSAFGTPDMAAITRNVLDTARAQVLLNWETRRAYTVFNPSGSSYLLAAASLHAGPLGIGVVDSGVEVTPPPPPPPSVVVDTPPATLTLAEPPAPDVMRTPDTVAVSPLAVPPTDTPLTRRAPVVNPTATTPVTTPVGAAPPSDLSKTILAGIAVALIVGAMGSE